MKRQDPVADSPARDVAQISTLNAPICVQMIEVVGPLEDHGLRRRVRFALHKSPLAFLEGLQP